MKTKTNASSTANKPNTQAKTAVKAKLTEEAKTTPVNGTSAKAKEDSVKAVPVLAPVSLDERIQNFEKLRGLANNREQLVSKLNELTKFNYNHDGSSQFTLRDSTGLEFKTTNTNFINLVTRQLQQTLEQRKQEIETQILEFEL
jgi:hypothetical protein